MINNQRKGGQVFKYYVLMILFCTNSFLSYSQKSHKFNLVEKFTYPTALKISIKVKEHEWITYIEEYLIHTKSIGDSHSVFKMYVFTLNYNLKKANIDTAIVLNGEQLTLLEDFCNYIYKNKIPNEYHGEPIEIEPSGVFVTYTMEIADEKYTFTDRRLLSLTTLVLYNKNNWDNVLLDTDN